MRLLLLALLASLPFHAAAATSSTILSSGRILSSFGEDGYREYDVAYKGDIYRCFTFHNGQSPSTITCFKLLSRPVIDKSAQ